MILKTDLIKWLLESGGEYVGIDEGGLTLVSSDEYGRQTGYYYELGGLPEFYDQSNEHPGYPVEDWQFEARNGDTYLGYTEWVDAKLEQQ